jgi:hypothetical protein
VLVAMSTKKKSYIRSAIILILLLFILINFENIVFWASTSISKSVDIGMQNVYDLNGEQLYTKMLKALKPDGGQIYTDDNNFIQFNPDGTFDSSTIDVYDQKTILGLTKMCAYQSAFSTNKLTMTHTYNMSSDDLNINFMHGLMDLKTWLKGMDKLKLKSVLKQYTIGKPDFYEIVFAGINYTSKEPDNNAGKTRLYISSKGITKLSDKQAIGNDVLAYYITPFYKGLQPQNSIQLTPPSPGTISYGGGSRIYEYVDTGMI